MRCVGSLAKLPYARRGRARDIGDGAAPKGATATAARVRRPPRRGGGARRARDRVASSPAATARRPCPC